MIEESGKGISVVDDLIKALTAKSVFVGVPEEETSREGEGVTNSQLTFLHTNGVRSNTMTNEMNQSGLPYSKAFQAYIASKGSALWKIPPRPIIEPAIENEANAELISEQLANVAKAFSESADKGAQEMEKLGLLGQSIIQDWFDNPANGWPENAQSTIDAKGSDRPLIDTGNLRKSMTYVIREG